MSGKAYRSELERALARPDGERMRQQLIAYAGHLCPGVADWPDDLAADFGDIITRHFDDPEKALAYVVIAASLIDDARFLSLLACGNLEGVLHGPLPEVLDRILAEARRSARFRSLLSHPFQVAIAERAWRAIEPFRITGPNEEPSHESLPER